MGSKSECIYVCWSKIKCTQFAKKILIFAKEACGLLPIQLSNKQCKQNTGNRHLLANILYMVYVCLYDRVMLSGQVNTINHRCEIRYSCVCGWVRLVWWMICCGVLRVYKYGDAEFLRNSIECYKTISELWCLYSRWWGLAYYIMQTIDVYCFFSATYIKYICVIQ